MTVTVNTLGPNSAEIVVINETNAQPAMNAVETFLVSKGWTRVSGQGNNYERIYSAANLTTGTKFIKINAMDLHIEHAEAYSGTTTVSATNAAFRHVNNGHLDYTRNLYAESTTTTLSSTSAIILDGSTIRSTSRTITIPAAQPEVLYPGQFIRVISRASTNVWFDAEVTDHNNVTGVVTFVPYGVGTGNDTGNRTDFSILTHNLKYNTGTPSYIYVSASARHVAIQAKYHDGTWAEWHAVMETENPANISIPSILTTGFMVSNSGYTNNSTASSSSTMSVNSSQPSLTSMHGSFRFWTGPYSQPRSRLNRTGVTASRFSKISTPLGEAGAIASYRRINVGYVSSNVLFHFMENLVHYKGMADVIPTVAEPATSKQWAFSGVALTDLTENAVWLDLLINTWFGYKINASTGSTFMPGATSDNYRWASVRELSSWRPHIPTMLGRIYGIKFVTSGLPAGNILSIKVDPSGFADESGIAQDHLVMNYQSQFVADSRQGTTTLESQANPISTADQAVIRQSQSASVAFPK